MTKSVDKIDGLKKSANIIKGGLAVVALLLTVFLFMVKDIKSSTDRLGRQHTEDLARVTQLINDNLTKLAVSNAEQRMEIKQLSKDVSTTNANVIWIQNRLIDKEK